MQVPAAGFVLLALLTTSTSRDLLPDMVVTRIDVRDRARLNLITPTAGHEITIYVDIQNRSSEVAPDMNLICRRSQFANGPALAEATVRTGTVNGNMTKSLTLTISGEASAGPGSMWCMIDGGNFVPESNENNNSLTFDFVHTVDLNTDFRVELRNFRPWPERTMHRSVYFEVYNPTGRGPAPPPPGVPQRLRWQVDCALPQMPWVSARAYGNMSNYAGGDVPAAGRTSTAAFWLWPVDLSGWPKVSTLPATLSMTCTITVGAFLPNIPILHSGDPTPQPDWGSPVVWWKQSVMLSIPNPEAATYQAPQDVSIASVSISASPTIDEPPQTIKTTYARFSVKLIDAVPSLEVRCTASGSGMSAQRDVSFTNTGTTVSGSANFGTLPAGIYNMLCVADPNKQIQDANLSNNSRSAQDTVFTPGPDLLVQKIDVRDQSRLALITPTAGHDILTYVDIQNRSAENAPDLALVCRRLASAGGATLAESSVRTGTLAPNAMKTLQVVVPSGSAGPAYMWCMVDGGNFVRESDETNNEKGINFTTEADRATDFGVEIRNLRPWPERSQHRSVAFDVVNTSPRGPASPAPPLPQRLRWQAVCMIPQMAWVRVRQVGNMTLYAGGDVPQPGSTQQGSFWIDPVDLSGMPPVSGLPATLQMMCTITVGAFLPNIPFLHSGDTLPQPDWGSPVIWWKQSVVLNLPNPEAR